MPLSKRAPSLELPLSSTLSTQGSFENSSIIPSALSPEASRSISFTVSVFLLRLPAMLMRSTRPDSRRPSARDHALSRASGYRYRPRFLLRYCIPSRAFCWIFSPKPGRSISRFSMHEYSSSPSVAMPSFSYNILTLFGPNPGIFSRSKRP